MTSQRLHLLILSHWELELQRINLRAPGTHIQSIVTCGNLWVVGFWMIFAFIFIPFILSEFEGHNILKSHGPVTMLNTYLFPLLVSHPYNTEVHLSEHLSSLSQPFSHYEPLEGWEFDEFTFISRI